MAKQDGKETREAGDQRVFITDKKLVERIEQLAHAQDMSLSDIAIACCRYGVHNYEEALANVEGLN